MIITYTCNVPIHRSFEHTRKKYIRKTYIQINKLKLYTCMPKRPKKKEGKNQKTFFVFIYKWNFELFFKVAE